jgi:Na+-transporting NADH:ubiquinone oxidoreductase subunit B
MRLLRKLLDKAAPVFEKDGKLQKFYPIYEMADTFLYTSGHTTKGSTHVRDAIDLKRVMTMVVIALVPCILMALYNTGYQAHVLLESQGITEASGWRGTILYYLGFSHDSSSIVANFIYGALYFMPVLMVTGLFGGGWEVLFAIVRKHEINEGFFVTMFLFPLILPPTIPLWQVAVGISFGVVIGKEVFGGTGMNVLNPALVGRAFLFFAYAGNISGDAVWIAADGVTAATGLAEASVSGIQNLNLINNFLGLTPGSMGETSTLACLIGAAILIITGIGSWRIMLSLVVSTLFFSLLSNAVGSPSNSMASMPFYWHYVLGGYAFGTVFMATDPVTAPVTISGKYIYGALIGAMVVLIRVFNLAFPEGMMLAILFGNVFAPVIDAYVVKYHIKKRVKQNA